MRIAMLDVDGVLLNVTVAVQDYCHKKYGKLITEDFVTAWDWEYCLGIPVTSEFWEHIWSTPSPPYKGANLFLEGLRNAGFHIILLSARPTTWEGLKNEGLAREAAFRDFGQLDCDEIVLVNHGKEKWEMINRMIEQKGVSPEFMVEDHPIYAKLIGENTPVKSYLLTKPWNKDVVSLTDSWERVFNYGDLLRRVSM